MATPRTFRFRPRYRALALSSIGLGGALGITAVAVLGSAMLPLATGFAGIALGAGYLVSPTWRFVVVVDDDAIEVRAGKTTKFRLAWADVERIIDVPESKSCVVDGGAPEKRLIIPGDGLPAPYEIENKDELYTLVLAHVPADKLVPAASLEIVKPTAGKAE